tara:strand:- start:1189 stop:2226 length:1038 start_codon:yes stop_codon:yes gene_type:complete
MEIKLKKDIDYFLKYEYHGSNSTIFNSSSLDQIVIFCGKNINQTLVSQINQLAKCTLKRNLLICITDRKDLNDFKLHKSIKKINLITREELIPKSETSINYLINELNSFSAILKDSKYQSFTHITRMRKDIFIDLYKFINYLESIPFLSKRYRYITTEDSTNLMRRFCISDQFFTIPIESIKEKNYEFKTKNRSRIKNWFWYRQPYEIFKNNHQPEQWLWLNILGCSSIDLKKSCSLKEYIEFLNTNILVLKTSQIGYFWTRGGSFYLNNWPKFSPHGEYLMKSTYPLKDFISYKSFFKNIFIQEKFIKFLYFYRLFFFICKFVKLIFLCIWNIGKIIFYFLFKK